MLRAAARRAYWGTQAWQDQALAAKRNASSTQMVSLATLQSLSSFRPGIAYVLDALYLCQERQLRVAGVHDHRGHIQPVE